MLRKRQSKRKEDGSVIEEAKKDSANIEMGLFTQDFLMLPGTFVFPLRMSS